MQLVEAKKIDFPEITVKLREMSVSKTTAMLVESEQVASVRPIISKLHRESDMRFTTKKTDTGILVWRVA